MPKATELAATVAVNVAFAKSEIVTLPVKSPANVIVKSSALKSKVPSLSS